MFDIPFSLEEAQKSNILISATNSMGKTRLACGIASTLQKLGWKIVVFDNSTAWLKASDIPYYYTVRHFYSSIPLPITSTSSVIIDISRLRIEEQINYIDMFVENLWNFRIDNLSWDRWIMLMFEESEIYMKTMRLRATQNLHRICHVGRNIHTRTLGVTTDLASISTEFIRLANQRYIGKLPFEENSKRKFRATYGKSWCEVANNLECGDFIYFNNGKMKVHSMPLFEPYRLPKPLVMPTPIMQPIAIPQPKPKKKRRFFNLF